MKHIRRGQFCWTYDPEGDVIHVTVDPMIPAYGEPLQDLENAVIVMKSVDDEDKVVGLRILGAKKNGLIEVKIKIDKARRAIEAFGIRTGEWRPTGEQETYARELTEVESILEDSPAPEELFETACS